MKQFKVSFSDILWYAVKLCVAIQFEKISIFIYVKMKSSGSSSVKSHNKNSKIFAGVHTILEDL